MSESELPGLYVHVPFCKTKCPYCDFYSVTSLSRMAEWLEALHKEILLYEGHFAVFDSIYLGGGTPTLLGDRELAELLDCLRRHFTFAPNTEITIEVNPDDVTADKPAFLRRLGIDRVSVGVQSFDEEELLFLRRRHTARQAMRALESIRSAGLRNLGLDLIYGFDAGRSCGGSVRQRWLKTLAQALEYEPEHLSCYQMTLEDATPFGRMRAEGKIKPLGERRESALFMLTSRFLENNGYIHYEISNFAKGQGYMSRHNSKYWRHVPYLGLGPSAHSFLNGMRWWNARSLDDYCRALGNGQSPVAGSETLTEEQLLLESLYLGLRTKYGIDVGAVSSGTESNTVLDQLEKSELIRIHEGKIISTRKGFLVADSLPLLLIH